MKDGNDFFQSGDACPMTEALICCQGAPNVWLVDEMQKELVKVYGAV
jgi:hypothetical protein